MSKHIPNTVEELIRSLDETFTEVVASPGDDHAATMFASGQRSVVLYLKQWLAKPHHAPVPRERGQGRPVN